MGDGDFKAVLLRENREFRKLHESHLRCEERLQELGRRGFLDTSAEVEARRLKKRKLALKDRMERMVRDRGAGRAAAAGEDRTLRV